MSDDNLHAHPESAHLGSHGEPASAYPHDVARALSYLANLIDGSIQLRGVGSGAREFAARFLGVPPVQVVASTRELGPIAFQLAALAFADDLRGHPPAAVIGEDEEEPPRWEQLDLGDASVPIPFCLSAAFSPGALTEHALVVSVGAPSYHERPYMIRVWTLAEHADEARTWIDRLVERSRRDTNPFRNRNLRASCRLDVGLMLAIEPVPTETRDELVLPEDVWDEIDRSVHGLFDGRNQLAAAGLRANRGLLLAGPPGVGKTAVCRVLAAELAGSVTTIFCDANAVSSVTGELYRELEHLTPALVVMEDLDLVVGHRRRGVRPALVELLLALEGGTSHHDGVVTIATTNDLDAIDEAARRAGRFDAVLHIAPPDDVGRARILRHYTSEIDCDVDIDRVAASCAGFTGADIRELVTRAVLHTVGARHRGGRDAISTELLVELARAREHRRGAGQYL